MSTEKSHAQDVVSAGLLTFPKSGDSASAGGVYTVTCVGADGVEKWSDTFHNLVVNEGLQYMNQTFFKGSGYTAVWYLGLVTGPGSGTTYAAGNTLASHAGWTENTDYTGSRKTVSFGTASTADPSVISNSASPSAFSITGRLRLLVRSWLLPLITLVFCSLPVTSRVVTSLWPVAIH